MRRLFYDIEVSPNEVTCWQAGYKVYIPYQSIKKERAVICIGYRWEWDSEATVLGWDRKQNDKTMLQEFSKVMSHADECVGHNIDRFDMPWVRTRCMYHRIAPVPWVKTCDTLQWARRYFKFNSNRLDYLARFLGLGCKIRTENDLWDAVCDGDKAAEKRMQKYCAQDVQLLQPVYELLAQYGCPLKTHVGVLNGNDAWSCAKCGSENVKKHQRRVTARGAQQQIMQCKDCGRYNMISKTAIKKYEERKAA